MKIGFTGSRNGCTAAQYTVLLNTFYKLWPSMTHFAHGDCVGCDNEAADLIHNINCAGSDHVKIVKHPPADRTHQAHNPYFHEERKPKNHFARNRAIADECGRLIACPNWTTDPGHGGTSYTIAYARKKRKPVTVIYPTGVIEELTPPKE